ncbi:MAG: 4-hydroxy-tetrahydrodipicolinate reductase, partial [Hyphomicrobiaceae bacterium]
MSEMKLAVMGAAGRMGRELVRAVHAMDGCVVAAALEHATSLALGEDAGLLAGLGKINVPITSDALDVVARVDGVLDFTVPAASIELADLTANARIVHVIGTTGFTPDQERAIEAAGRHAV